MARHLMEYIEENGITELVYLGDCLKEELGIKYKLYEVEGRELVVLNYCQIESPKTHPIVMECRGVILQKVGEQAIEVVCKPFDRFFNLGEALDLTGDFQLSTSQVLEKVDGSLIKVYYWNDSWRIATRGTAFAEFENYTGKVFLDMVLEAFGVDSLEGFDLIMPFKKDFTLLFEFTSPENRIVTPYKEAEMVFLGAVDNKDFTEYHEPWYLGDVADKVGSSLLKFRAPKVFSTCAEKHELMQHVSGLDEGFVCYDPISDVRVKVKSDAYVAVHKLRGDSLPTPKRIMALVVENEEDEYLAYFPEDRQLFTPYITYFKEFGMDLVNVYQSNKDIEEQKDFAIAIKDFVFKPVLFMARKSSTKPYEVFNRFDNRQKVRYLAAYIEERSGE